MAKIPPGLLLMSGGKRVGGAGGRSRREQDVGGRKGGGGLGSFPFDKSKAYNTEISLGDGEVKQSPN